MEHLFFNPSQKALDREAAKIAESKELDCDWNEVPDLADEITWRQFRCLCWMHDDSNILGHDETHGEDMVSSFWNYAKVRGFNFGDKG